jgi:ribose/xylose/arabinose/galactoside ABC-type transport system permease subunit
MKFNTSWKKMFSDYMVWTLVIATFLILSLTIPNYFSITNFIFILVQSVTIGVLAIGEAYVLMTGNFDLSIEATLGFSVVLAGWLITAPPVGLGIYLHPLLGLLIALGVGVLVGLLNGLLIVKLGINSFLVTLAMQITLRGFAFLVTKGATLYNLPALFRKIGGATLIHDFFPVSIIIGIVFYLGAYWMLEKSSFGRKILMVGGNKEACKSSGIKTDKVLILVFIISSVLASVGGVILGSRLNTIPCTLGQNMGFTVIAACVLGGVSLTGGKGTILGVLGGVLFLGLIESALTVLDVSPYWVMFVRGLVILLAIVIDRLKNTSKPLLKLHSSTSH